LLELQSASGAALLLGVGVTPGMHSILLLFASTGSLSLGLDVARLGTDVSGCPATLVVSAHLVTGGVHAISFLVSHVGCATFSGLARILSVSHPSGLYAHLVGSHMRLYLVVDMLLRAANLLSNTPIWITMV
jgi:hypothetical protein